MRLPGWTERTKCWNFAESCVGATKGGSSVKIEPEFYSVEPDGSTVAIKDFKRKIGEKATMEINLIELTEDMLEETVEITCLRIITTGNSSKT